MSIKRTLVAASLLLLFSAPVAHASPAVQFGIQDDAWLAAGPQPNTLSARIATLKKLGVKIVRYNLRWDEIATARPTLAGDPADPAYDWSYSDPVLDALHAAGIPVLLTIYGTPSWANGDHAPAYAPTSASSIAGFARAAALRYPWVRKWAIWNEPNEIRWLRPVSAQVYVQKILNPAYAALHQAISGVQVAGGVTAPRGNGAGLSPVAWVHQMHAAHARFDAYAHNPYPSSPAETPFSGGSRYGTTVTMATLPRLISTIDRYFGAKPIWITEYAYQTTPDRVQGVSFAKQALYTSEAALRTWQLPQVSLVIHFLYRDEPSLSGWQSGLETVTGKLKPAFDAFRLPLAEASRLGTTTVLWGQVRPRSGRQPFRLQQLVGGSWHTVGSSTRWTSASGVYQVTVHAARGVRFRVWSLRDRAASATLTVA